MTGHPDWLAAYRVYQATDLLDVTLQYPTNATINFAQPSNVLSDCIAGHITSTARVFWRLFVRTPTGDIAYRKSGMTELGGTIGAAARPAGGAVELSVSNTLGAFLPIVTTRLWDYIGPKPRDLEPVTSQRSRIYTLPPGSSSGISVSDDTTWDSITWAAWSDQTFEVEVQQTLLAGDPGVGSATLLDTLAFGTAGIGIVGTFVTGAYSPIIMVRNTSANPANVRLSVTGWRQA